jgi:pyrimidine-specific ribonucleoside hydrolase
VPSRPSDSRRLIIDCDPGVDDAAALLVALADPRVEVDAITTVAGNVPLGQVTRNALGILKVARRTGTALAAGAQTPLLGIVPPEAGIHGPTGLGRAQPPEGGKPLPNVHAIELLADRLEQTPEPLTLAAIGPLTNIALLLTLRPDLVPRIERLVLMGTSSGDGNITPLAEFNTFADPEAAHVVFAQPDLEVIVMELETTRQATVDQDLVGRLREASPSGRLLADAIEGYGDGTPDARPLHDLVVVGAIVEPEMVVTRSASVEIVTERGEERGRSVYRFDEAGDRGPAVQLSGELDAERLRALLLERVSML